jgi:DNA polymerase-3 subunit epsilon
MTLPLKPTVVPDTILVLDTETDGVDRAQHVVLEIGAIWWSVVHGCILGCWSELVVRATNAAQSANGIPSEALRYGLPWEHAIEGLKSRVARADLIVAHNAPFDEGFLPELGKPWVDTMDHFPWPLADHGLALIKVAVAHGVAVTHAHRALTDCFLIAHTLERIYEREGADGIRERFRLAMRPRSRCVAMTTYAQKEITKKAKFRWNADMKSWWKDVVDEEISSLPFEVRPVPKNSPEWAALAKW